MIKIKTDPITNRIISYEKVLSTTILYRDDILLEDSEVPSMDLTKYFINGKIVSKEKDKYEKELEEIETKLLMFQSFDEEKCFFDFVKNGATLEEARIQLFQKLEEKENMEDRYNQMIQQHNEEIYNFYAQQYKEKEETMYFPYYSSVVLLIKDENKYLKEWIDWYVSLGFDHIFIYDNGTKEDVNDIIQVFDDDVKNKIMVISWKDKYNNIQQDAYNHFLENGGKQCRWCLFADSDEFLRFNNDTENVNAFLKNYENYTEVWGYLEEYNANGQEIYEDKPVRERFTQKFDEYELYYWKNFIQVNRIDCFQRHYAYYNEDKGRCYRNEKYNKDLFVIEHYYTKSWEEWKEKIITRGACDPLYKRKLNEFFNYNPDMEYLKEEDTEQFYQGGM
ncbi:glycosyltransferase family 2 protein [Bacteroides caecimuris]|uniref:glycosyltransferase family 2 protein n=1 Tax=Bacteroides caecimuris TaxID=1796613 RepID=UPI0025700E72|nr:glycosyltransferase family 2 protein [Bacteroides caecimuris]